MKLSIIVPAYNVEDYLAACIVSLVKDIEGNYKEEFEIVIVNDGSTDNTLNLALQIANECSYVKVIDKINGGLSDARNTGINASSGKFLSFIDSDDIMKANFIKDILYVIDKFDDVDVITFDIHKFFGKPCFSVANFSYSTVVRDFYCSKPLIACNKIYRSDLFNNIKFPVGKYFEDIWTTPKLILLAKSFIHISNDYYGYRQRKGSITASVDSKYMDILGALNSVCNRTDSDFIKNVMVSQFFTLMLLSLRLPLRYASKNISIIFASFYNLPNVTPYNNKNIESIAFMLFKLLGKRSKLIFLICKPLVSIHLFIKNFRGR